MEISRHGRKKVAVIGKGEPTNIQNKLIEKAIGNYKIIKIITTLNNVNDIPNEADNVISLIAAPTVLNILNKWYQTTGKDYYVFTIAQKGSYSQPNSELEKEYDIKYTKELNGQKIYTYSKTKSLIKNPRYEIKYDEEITL